MLQFSSIFRQKYNQYKTRCFLWRLEAPFFLDKMEPLHLVLYKNWDNLYILLEGEFTLDHNNNTNSLKLFREGYTFRKLQANLPRGPLLFTLYTKTW